MTAADAGDGRQLAEAAGSRVPVHPQAASVVEKERAARALSRGAVNSAADGTRQRDQDDLGALAADPLDTVLSDDERHQQSLE